jgi:hypothetical protein
VRHLLSLGRIAEGTAPGEVVDVVRAVPSLLRIYRVETTRDAVSPEAWGYDVIDVELTARPKQAVLADITRSQANREADGGIEGVVLGSLGQRLHQLVQARGVIQSATCAERRFAWPTTLAR